MAVMGPMRSSTCSAPGKKKRLTRKAEMAIGSASRSGRADEAAEHPGRQGRADDGDRHQHDRSDQPAEGDGRDGRHRRQRALGERVEPVEGARAGASDEVGDASARGGESVRRSPSATRRRRRRCRLRILEQPLTLREAGLGAARHGGQDEVDHEEGHELVDRVRQQALLEGRGLQVRAGLPEGGDQEVGAAAGDAAEHVGADRGADQRGDEPGHDAGDRRRRRRSGRAGRRAGPGSRPRRRRRSGR